MMERLLTLMQLSLVKVIKLNHQLIIFAFLFVSLRGTDFQHSKVVEIPDLSFMPHVYTGLDVLEQMDFSPISGKTIGVFCNQTSLDRKGRHILDVLKERDDVDIYVIFTPQYGLFGDQVSKTKMLGRVEKDPNTGARIVNLLDRFVKPPEWSIRDVDIVLADIQDTGVRYSTYMTTLTKIMEVASELHKPVIVLDRPNPLRGDRVDGPVVRPAFQSFEGYHLVPIRHGLTIGEYALMVNEMGWVKDLSRVELTIIPMANWQRSHWADENNLPETPLGPGITDVESCLAYCGMELLKGTNLNGGQGTTKPYFRVGAPWISGKVFYNKLKGLHLPGIRLSHIQYSPHLQNPDGSVPLYYQEKCSGVEIEIMDRETFDPLATSTSIMILAYQLYPHQFQWIHDNYIDKLYGYNLLPTFAAQGKMPDYLPPQWMHDVIRFNEFRQKFLLYK
ncbi:MAG: DUF1343 domain-containing protein [Fidelibacterota bacterium]